jgi:hypothetical protein
MAKTLTVLSKEAFEGIRSSCEEFLRQFLDTELIVPDRHQPNIQSTNPEPFSPFFPFFCYEFEGETFIPCFEKEEQLTEWCSKPLTYRRSLGLRIIDLIPPNCWLVFNPGSEVEKPFSPWELSLLRLGSAEAITEVISELFDTPTEELLDANALFSGEHPQLFAELQKICENRSQIDKAWILEVGLVQDSDTPSNEVLVGFLVTKNVKKEGKETEIDELQATLQNLLAPLMIGRGSLRVVVLTEISEGIFGPLFKAHAPVFDRNCGRE